MRFSIVKGDAAGILTGPRFRWINVSRLAGYFDSLWVQISDGLVSLVLAGLVVSRHAGINASRLAGFGFTFSTEVFVRH